MKKQESTIKIELLFDHTIAADKLLVSDLTTNDKQLIRKYIRIKANMDISTILPLLSATGLAVALKSQSKQTNIIR